MMHTSDKYQSTGGAQREGDHEDRIDSVFCRVGGRAVVPADTLSRGLRRVGNGGGGSTEGVSLRMGLAKRRKHTGSGEITVVLGASLFACSMELVIVRVEIVQYLLVVVLVFAVPLCFSVCSDFPCAAAEQSCLRSYPPFPPVFPTPDIQSS